MFLVCAGVNHKITFCGPYKALTYNVTISRTEARRDTVNRYIRY